MIKLLALLVFNVMGAVMFYIAYLFDYGAFELLLVAIYLIASAALTMTIIGGEEAKK